MAKIKKNEQIASHSASWLLFQWMEMSCVFFSHILRGVVVCCDEMSKYFILSEVLCWAVCVPI